MSEPTDSDRFSPLDFEADKYRYAIQRPLVSHPDYDPLLIASRQSVEGGALKRVILKPILLGDGHELRTRAVEEVQLSGFLRHPNISRVLGSAFNDERAYVVMDMDPGRFLLSLMELRDFLQADGQPPYGAKQAKAEVKHLFDQAPAPAGLPAYSVVETGALPVPPDMNLEDLED